jgi:hypothetical protein
MAPRLEPRALLSIGLVLVLTTAAIAQAAAVRIMVGGHDNLDACGSQGQVSGLNANGDNFLAVRAGPGTSYEKFDELHTGDVVNICMTQSGWLGIVYTRHKGEDCGVGTPLPRDLYRGPCRTGWVAAQYVTTIAG